MHWRSWKNSPGRARKWLIWSSRNKPIWHIARKIYELRTKAKLSQAELAGKVGTTQSVISRLEDADYDGHSLPMLRRIASALEKRVEIRFLRSPKLQHA